MTSTGAAAAVTVEVADTASDGDGAPSASAADEDTAPDTAAEGSGADDAHTVGCGGPERTLVLAARTGTVDDGNANECDGRALALAPSADSTSANVSLGAVMERDDEAALPSSPPLPLPMPCFVGLLSSATMWPSSSRSMLADGKSKMGNVAGEDEDEEEKEEVPSAAESEGGEGENEEAASPKPDDALRVLLGGPECATASDTGDADKDEADACALTTDKRLAVGGAVTDGRSRFGVAAGNGTGEDDEDWRGSEAMADGMPSPMLIDW